MNACPNWNRFRTRFRVLMKCGITMPCTRTGIPLQSIPAGDGRRQATHNDRWHSMRRNLLTDRTTGPDLPKRS